jgi:hypothetical protein
MRTPEEFLLAAIRAIDRMPEDPGTVKHHGNASVAAAPRSAVRLGIPA